MSGTKNEGKQVSFLEMSDEEMLNTPPPELPTATDVSTDTELPGEGEDGQGNGEGGDDEGKGAGGNADQAATDAKEDAADDKEDKERAEKAEKTEKANDDGAANEAGDSQAEAGKDKEKEKDGKDPKDVASDKEKEAKPADTQAIDYKAEYERLLAPFKANGKEIKVDSVDDAVALMQMGANYSKKMSALKPNLKLLKMLENNGFLSEEKIGFLIDLGKKDPNAINKLVKDSGMDPMDLDAEKAKAYKPTAYAVDDREIELDTVLDELKDSPTYTRTLDVVSNKWDAASKQTISQSPQLLKIIDSHIASGIYDRISTEMEREKMLGRLSGLSDIEAYRKVGDAIHARGGFNSLQKPSAAAPKPTEPVIVEPKPKPADDDKLKDKRRAASSTQPAAPAAAAKDFNPLAMSDEEFSKLTAPVFRT